MTGILSGLGDGMVNRGEWQRLSAMREREAKVLLDAGEYAGAYYLCGYAVECALKACIVRGLPAESMPEKKDVDRFYTHDLDQLLTLAKLRDAFLTDEDRKIDWNIVTDWNERARYRNDITGAQAASLYRICTESTIGVLPWLRTVW